MLRYDDSCARCKTGEESDEQVYRSACASAYGGKGFLSEELAHDDSICCIVQLLEECTEKDREEEGKQLLPDYSLCDSVAACSTRFHMREYSLPMSL